MGLAQHPLSRPWGMPSDVRIGILSAGDSNARKVATAASKFVRERFPDTPLRSDLGPPAPDIAVVVGPDRHLLRVLRELPDETAVLAVGTGFHSEVPPHDLTDALDRILHGRHWIEERLRLSARIGENTLPPALNEIALTASRGGGFLRYSLAVDGERVWRDGSDGIVIATPTGSTGYGLSAGGPIVVENAEAIVIVPISSAEGQRPLVLSKDSVITIDEIESRLGRDLVIDGQDRIRLRVKEFTVRASARPACFVRFGKARYLRVFGKLRSKRRTPELPVGLPPSARFAYHILRDQGPLTERQLIAESGLPERTARNALVHLEASGLIRKGRSLRDAREVLFSVSA